MTRHAALAVLLLTCATAVSAAGPSGQVAAYGTMSEIEVDPGSSDDGNGFGIKGWFAPFGNGVFFNAEYQTTALDFIDLESLRAGGGYYHPLGKTTGVFGYAEFIDLGSDVDESGFGVHGGVHHQFMPMFGVQGQLGYLMLDDTDGLEAGVEAQFNFTPMIGAFAGFRTYLGADDFADVTITDVRAGVVLTLGEM